ncbi:diacylglycerol/lipid kinase family protein [Bacillus sp. JJ1764]|uniref:diacylglycerol/lipid kinase family protein n=1 Tax=Bacillus sp. JJ1764 TaxID=3122964 RepID=UPI003000BD67
MKQIYFIVNPKAKNGRCAMIWKRLEEHLTSEKINFLAFFTEYPGHAKNIANGIAKNNDHEKVMITVGGDGTMHEVMNGVIKHKHITLGFIPGGSGNDFSRGYLIPSEPLEALKVLLRLIKQEPSLVDCGKIDHEDNTEHFFINNMGAGFDALVALKVNQSRMKALLNKLALGRLVYVYFLLKELFTYKTSTTHLLIDGQRHIFEQTWFVTVSNQPFYGGGMKIAPAADPQDGLLDITVVHQLSRFKLLLVFISVYWGKHIFFNEVKTFKGKKISIESSHTLSAHGDGEQIGSTPLYIHVQKHSLQVLTRRRNAEEVDVKESDTNELH